MGPPRPDVRRVCRRYDPGRGGCVTGRREESGESSLGIFPGGDRGQIVAVSITKR